MDAPEEGPEFLRSVPIFAGLPDAAIDALARRADRRELVAGAWIFREGDRSDGLYVVRSGRVEVVSEAVEPHAVIRSLGPSAVLGELGVLAASTRSASVRARRDSVLLKVSSAAFLALLRDRPELALTLVRRLASQLQASRPLTLPKDAVPRVIAVVSLTKAPDRRAVAAELEHELARLHSVKLLDADEAGREPSFGDALDRWERARDQVLLPAALDGGGDWTGFCLRQADRVLALADPSPLCPTASAPLRGIDLAMLDWPDSAPALSALVDAHDPRAVHLVDDRVTGIARLARRLAGRAIGVVLSGGGARGMAHLGVLEELLAAGVVIDRVGGSSMGALVGALFASGLDPAEIEHRLAAEFVDRSPINDYTVPLAALVRGRKARAMLGRLFGDRRMETLPTEFFCVSCDLVTSELIVHRRGPLAEGVGASICLPGVAPPFALGGRLLVDGGVLNNLPVGTMAARGEGPVIAVDVSSRFQPPTRTAAGAARPGLARLSAATRRAVIGSDAPLPSFRETITRTIVLGSVDTAEAAQRHAELVIAPAVQGIGLTDFARIGEIREQGAAAAREVLRDAPSWLFAGRPT